MSIELVGDVIQLAGSQNVDDPERLLALLHDDRQRTVDLTQAVTLHTAIFQILLAYRPNLIGPAADPFFNRWLMPLLTLADRDVMHRTDIGLKAKSNQNLPYDKN
jgi:hypothetical protein